jgi:ribose 5-phosphate isomerase A
MKWDHNIVSPLDWSSPISNREAKQEVAERIAAMVQDGDVIGFGSGSTSFLAIHAIAKTLEQRRISCTAIPTSLEVALTCSALGIRTASLMEARPDWVFDGADEVDPRGDLIKGRGGAMFREKLLIDSSPKAYILIDQSKLVDFLGKRFPVPVEVYPAAANLVTRQLEDLGASEIVLRLGLKKDGPVITENGNLIIDVKFTEIRSGFERRVKAITGVIESGLFQGRQLETIVASA